VLCLFGFIVAAFLAIVPPALADQPANVPADASGSFPDSISATRRPGLRQLASGGPATTAELLAAAGVDTTHIASAAAALIDE
jgi:hypothetical protein